MSSSYFDVLAPLARAAGDLIMSHRRLLEASVMKEPNEIVTAADIAANDFIVLSLTDEWPEIPVYAEEGSAHKSDETTRWIVDPLDGTTPWVWGNSGFAVSIALELAGEIVVGAVYDPVMQELFYAERGAGASRDGDVISPSKGLPLEDSLLTVDWGNEVGKRTEGLGYLSKMLLPEQCARRIVPQFAPALGLCRVAEGRTHGLICNDTWLEDHSAGALILQEAGGHVTNFYDRDSFDHRRNGIIATADSATHSAVVGVLTSA